MIALIDAYFDNINTYLPLLHRPTFERRLRENAHLEEQAFGAVVLLVCACGSRFSDDLRVRKDLSSRYSSGWSYYEQVATRRPALSNPSLYDLQQYCVCRVSICRL